MKLYIGADHRGFELKEGLKKFLVEEEVDFVDVGAETLIDDDDYIDYAVSVAKPVGVGDVKGEDVGGILICGSGIGMDMVANKFRGVRAGLCYSDEHVGMARHDDDINVLCLAADYIPLETAIEMVKVFLGTPACEEGHGRHKARVDRVKELEEGLV